MVKQTSKLNQCDNAIDHITVSGTAGTIGYTWAPATGLSSTTIAGPTANPSSNTTYTLTVTSPQGCTATSSVDTTATSEGTYSGINSLIGEDLIRVQDSYYYQQFSYLKHTHHTQRCLK